MADKRRLRKGMKIKIIEKGKIIDRAVIRHIGTGGSPLTQEIEIESLELSPGERGTFALINSRGNTGWRMLFWDQFARCYCFSQLAPTYKFEPI